MENQGTAKLSRGGWATVAISFLMLTAKELYAVFLARIATPEGPVLPNTNEAAPGTLSFLLESRYPYWAAAVLAWLAVLMFWLDKKRAIQRLQERYETGGIPQRAKRLQGVVCRIGEHEYSAAEFLVDIMFEQFPGGATGPNLCHHLKYPAKREMPFEDLAVQGVAFLKALEQEGAIERFESEDYDDESGEWAYREHIKPNDRGLEIARWLKGQSESHTS